MSIKENFATNLIKCRKSEKLTQIELAEKLNYSDKAISKWERAESIPDVETLKTVADFFGVSLDYLISEPKIETKELIRLIPKKRALIAAAATVFIWLIAVMCFSFLGVLFPEFLHKTWLSFIWAIPVTFVVLVILTSVWGKNLLNLIFFSLLLWTAMTAIFLSLLNLLQSAPVTLWMIFLIGIPAQILLILLFTYKKFKK